MDAANADQQLLYERMTEKLIAHVKRINEAETGQEKWSPTPERKRLVALSDRLIQLADDLDQDMSLEDFHDRRGEPETVVGPDGLPYKEEPYVAWPSYKRILSDLRELANSARESADALPNSRDRRALDFAALGLLHILCECGFKRPVTTESGADVARLEEICAKAGLVRARSSLKNALGGALEKFDPHFFEPGMQEVFFC